MIYKLQTLESKFGSDIEGEIQVPTPQIAGINYQDLFKIALFILVGYFIIKLLTR
jgi:hypothetical protein